MMTRRMFLGSIILSVLAVPVAADAQQPRSRPRIGYLRSGSAADAARYREALRQGLRDRGYVEGQSITIETRAAEGSYDRLPELAADLVRLQVDVIVAGGTPAVQAAKQATATIPIVMSVSTDPVGAGLIASLARPGGNVTGVSLGTGERFAGKWVELLQQALPQISRVAILWDQATSPSIVRPLVQETERAAQTLGLRLHLLKAHDAYEIGLAFADMTSTRAQGLVVLPSVHFTAERRQIVALAVKHRLPSMYEHREFVDAGGLMSYGPNLLAQHGRAAYFVEKILKGARPTDLPVEEPTKYELVVNVKAARALGLTIPQSLLVRADEVIQ